MNAEASGTVRVRLARPESYRAERVPKKNPLRKSPLVAPDSTSRLAPSRSFRTSMNTAKKLATPSRNCWT